MFAKGARGVFILLSNASLLAVAARRFVSVASGVQCSGVLRRCWPCRGAAQPSSNACVCWAPHCLPQGKSVPWMLTGDKHFPFTPILFPSTCASTTNRAYPKVEKILTVHYKASFCPPNRCQSIR